MQKRLKNTVLDNKISNDTYDIPVHIIKLSKHIIAPDLTTIFNKCIDEGIYPDALKVAKVIPIQKSGDTSNPSDYRPTHFHTSTFLKNV